MEHVLMAQSMEPVIHSNLNPDDMFEVIFREGDPQLNFRLVVDVETGKKWLNERLQLLGREAVVVEVSDWTQGSVGYASVNGTDDQVSSVQRHVTYTNRYGTYELWQQVKVEWVEGAKERGEHYEYAISDGLGTIIPCGSEGGAKQQLQSLSPLWKKVRQRVSEWEEF